MTQGELGMLLVMILCMVFTTTTVFTADKRIKQEKKSKCEYRDLYQQTYRKLLPQKMLNVRLEKELTEATGTSIDYEKMLLDIEEERNVEEIPITDIATELCKRSDVIHFMIDVKNDRQKFSLSGGE